MPQQCPDFKHTTGIFWGKTPQVHQDAVVGGRQMEQRHFPGIGKAKEIDDAVTPIRVRQTESGCLGLQLLFVIDKPLLQCAAQKIQKFVRVNG